MKLTLSGEVRREVNRSSTAWEKAVCGVKIHVRSRAGSCTCSLGQSSGQGWSSQWGSHIHPNSDPPTAPMHPTNDSHNSFEMDLAFKIYMFPKMPNDMVFIHL